MLYSEIEEYFESKEKTENLLREHESLFLDISGIEDKLRNAEITTPGEIEKYLDIVTVLENKCYAIYVVADTFKTGAETRAKHNTINNMVKDGKKVNVSQAKETASGEVQYLRRVRNLFQMYKDRALNLKGTLKAKYYNNTKYKSEDGEN